MNEPAPTVVSAPEPQARLDKSLFHGIAWTGGVKWAGQLLSWSSLLIVARLLSPADFGLVSMASAYLGLITVVTEFGIGTAVITLRDLSIDQLDQLNCLSVLLGVAGFAFSVLVAFPLAWFFHSPQLPPVVVAMSVLFLITGFKSVPFALLQRDMRFKLLSLIDGGRALILAGVTILLAFAGFRYWTLVCGSLLSAVISTVLTLMARRAGIRWPHRQSLNRAVTMSWHMLASRVSWYLYSNADFVVAGRVLGESQLGIYTVGWTVASTPVQYVTAQVGSVTSAFFSVVQSDYQALRRYLLNLTEGLALITFPLSIGLALLVKDFVLLVLGTKWYPIVPCLRLLAAYAAVRSITPLLSPVLTVTGDTAFGMKISIFSVILYPLGFYLGSRWGVVGIATAWMIVDPVLNLPVYIRVFGKLKITSLQYLEALRPPLTGVIAMSFSVLTVASVLPSVWPLAIRFALEVASGAAAYVAVLMTFHRQRITAFYGRFRQANAAT